MQSIPDAPYISLQEELPDGPVPTDVWNAFIREFVDQDRPMSGTLNSAKVYKRGEALLIDTDNILVKNFLPKEDHRRIFMAATYTVMGQYLTPIICNPEDLASLDNVAPAPAAPVETAEEPTRQEEATQVAQVVQTTQTAQAAQATQATQTDEPEDPILPFIDKLTALGVDLTIEE